MAGRLVGNDPVDYSLLAPRPFRTTQQYQSVTTSSGSTSPRLENVQRSPSPRQPFGQEEARRRVDWSMAQPPAFLSPQEPAEWGFIGQSQRMSPKPPPVPSPGAKERVIPIKVVGEPRRVETTYFRPGPPPQPSMEPFMSPLSNGDPFFSEFRQGPRMFPDVRQRPPSVLGIGGGRNGVGVERIIPVRVEGSRRFSVPDAEPMVKPVQPHLPPQPQSQPAQPPKTVRFSDYEQHRLITSPEPAKPILASPVYAEERRAPVRGGSLVRQVSVPTPTAEPVTSIAQTPPSQPAWAPQAPKAPAWAPFYKRPADTVTKASFGDGTAVRSVQTGVNGRRVEEAPVEAPPLVKMLDAAVLDGPLKEFVQLSSKIGGDVESIGALTKDAFQAQRVFLWKAAGMGKPNEGELANLLKPISEKIEAIQGMKSAKRSSAFFNHLSAIAEGIPALGWVTVSPTPAPFIKEMSDASQFYTNRVLKDFKEKDKTHTDWVKAWLQTLSELQQFVKQNHTTGLVWNTTPGAAPSAGGAVSGGPPPPPPISGMPPPPPPPPPPADFGKNLDVGSDADARAALFAEINKGLDITKGLKKVTADMQTHKNPALRVQAPVAPGGAGDQNKPVIPPKPAHLSNGSGSTPSPPGAKKPAATAGPEHAPVLVCEGGKKWLVEYHKGNRNITVEIADMKQVVYIYKCVDCVIQIKGKANSITMDSCKKTSIVFDNLLSSIEIINCQSAQVQTLGAMPTLTIQKTDGCQVYLSRDSLNAEIVTSKSSEMNVLVPDETGEFREFPVPEQYRTVVKGNKLVTEVVDIA